jgi:hypothetical protein
MNKKLKFVSRSGAPWHVVLGRTVRALLALWLAAGVDRF